MTVNSRIQLLLASLLFVAVSLYDLWLWQPERQVRLHQSHFQFAAENKKWSRFASFIDPRYSDRWGHDKTFVVRETSEVLRQFFALSIESGEWDCEVESNRATVTTRLRLEGNGTAVAEFAKQAVNSLHQPFVFVWVRQSWKPWDWQLAHADNAQLRMSDWRD